MGTDKAFLQLDRLTLLERAIATIKQACDLVVIVGDKQRFGPYGVVVEDVFREHGPLGAIHGALTSPFAAELNVVLAVDTPAIPSALLRHLIWRAQESDFAVTVPRAGGRLQPLCAVYRQTFAATAERSLAAGKNKIDPLFQELAICTVDEAEINTLGLEPDIFHNVNTPEDWRGIRQKLGTTQE
jgi:molybdenum cofactor guanylyltransferase